jgi:hypothetical protein
LVFKGLRNDARKAMWYKAASGIFGAVPAYQERLHRVPFGQKAEQRLTGHSKRADISRAGMPVTGNPDVGVYA